MDTVYFTGNVVDMWFIKIYFYGVDWLTNGIGFPQFPNIKK